MRKNFFQLFNDGNSLFKFPQGCRMNPDRPVGGGDVPLELRKNILSSFGKELHFIPQQAPKRKKSVCGTDQYVVEALQDQFCKAKLRN